MKNVFRVWSDNSKLSQGPKDLEERSKEDGVRDVRSPKDPQERSKGDRMRDMRGPKDLQGDEEWQVPMQKDENGPEFTETPFESGGGYCLLPSWERAPLCF